CYLLKNLSCRRRFRIVLFAALRDGRRTIASQNPVRKGFSKDFYFRYAQAQQSITFRHYSTSTGSQQNGKHGCVTKTLITSNLSHRKL
ncbi:MAG: hypothetical protein ACM34A_19275, partial [Bacillota bacterium]